MLHGGLTDRRAVAEHHPPWMHVPAQAPCSLELDPLEGGSPSTMSRIRRRFLRSPGWNQPIGIPGEDRLLGFV